MTRCGSYGLMNLAADYGVDYGDVLLVADAIGAERRDEPLSVGRWQLAEEAVRRCFHRLGAMRYSEFYRDLAAHAQARWGRRPGSAQR